MAAETVTDLLCVGEDGGRPVQREHASTSDLVLAGFHGTALFPVGWCGNGRFSKTETFQHFVPFPVVLLPRCAEAATTPAWAGSGFFRILLSLVVTKRFNPHTIGRPADW